MSHAHCYYKVMRVEKVCYRPWGEVLSMLSQRTIRSETDEDSEHRGSGSGVLHRVKIVP